MEDLEKNAKVIKANYATISSFKEYRARLSKHLIDKLDYLIYKRFNLTKEECEFLVNYELEFRTDTEESSN